MILGESISVAMSTSDCSFVTCISSLGQYNLLMLRSWSNGSWTFLFQEKAMLKNKQKEIEEADKARRDKIIVTFDLVGRKVCSEPSIQPIPFSF